MSAKPTVLLVDDSQDFLSVLSHLFESSGAQVLTATSGPDALAIASDTLRDTAANFKLVILDIRMPTMRGPEVAKKLREQGFQGKIVAMTAAASGAGRDQSKVAGIDLYLSKTSMKRDLVCALVSEATQP